MDGITKIAKSESRLRKFLWRKDFGLLFINLHYSDNKRQDTQIRVYKLIHLFQKLISNCQKL